MGHLLAKLAPADREWGELVDKMLAALARGDSVAAFASSLGLGGGVTGYVYHTVPVAVYAWLRHYGDFPPPWKPHWTAAATPTRWGHRRSVGRRDVGAGGIPADWIAGIIDWPRSVGLLRKVASRLGQQKRTAMPLA